jgi:hypothetical protein
MNMNLIELLFLVLPLALSAPLDRKIDANEIWAVHTARALWRIRGAEDLNGLPIKTADRAALAKEVKSLKGFVKPSIAMKSRTQLVISSLTLDFKSYDRGLLFLNGKEVVLGKDKTFAYFRTLITGKRTSSLELLFPKAFAEVDPSSQIVLVTAICALNYAHELGVSPIPDATLEETIIHTYANEAKGWRENTESRHAAAEFQTLIFSCENSDLIQIVDTSPVSEGKIVRESNDFDMRMDFDPHKKVYTFTNTLPDCTAQADESGAIIESTKGCPPVQKDIFTLPPFFKFPLIARQCCRKTNCYEKVRGALDKIKAGLLKPASQPVDETVI